MAEHIDYWCPDCGAEATTSRDPSAKPGDKSSRIVVPHKVGCPVAVRLAEVRAAVAARGKR